MSKHNTDKKGRSKRDRFTFISLPHFLLDSDAWHELTTAARAILIQILRRYNGFNNGRIAASNRELAKECNVAPNTVTASLRALIGLGFIEITQEGSFNFKKSHATEFRLTWLRCDREGKPALNQWQTFKAKTPQTMKPEPISHPMGYGKYI